MKTQKKTLISGNHQHKINLKKELTTRNAKKIKEKIQNEIAH